jgi:diguanylate cyclase (GGDEF)-like protein
MERCLGKMLCGPHCRGAWNLSPEAGAVAACPAPGKSWGSSFALGIVVATLAFALPARAQDDDVRATAQRIESSLAAYPQRTLHELARWAEARDNVAPTDRRYLMGLYGQAMVQAGRVADASELADRLDAEAGVRSDALLAIDAKLIRSAVQWRAGDATAAHALAQEARDALRGSDDPFLAYWAALAAGVTSRARGQFEPAVESLHAALAQADHADDANRRAEVRYQLAVLTLALKQPQQAFEESQQAFRQAALARNPFVMAKAKMAESAALEALQRPGEELEALEEALSIARTTQSETAEGMALVNLADIYLRRREFHTAYDLSRGALDVARETDDASLMATSKANMGFALLAQNRIDAGKRLADEALADYERAGANAEIASLLGEYGHYLEVAGDHKAALALLHRERRLHDEISLDAHEKAVLEIQGRYESERRKREIELLNRDNAQKSAELDTRHWQDRISWLAASAFAALFAVVATLYRKLRLSNRLLAERNHELRSQSARDPLTSLYNRRHFQDFIRVAPIAGADDDSRANTQGLLLLDLDHFKTVNDRHGHAGGDAVLIAIAGRLRETLREEDMVVRWGGEEFLVYAPAVSPGRLDDIALRLMDAVSRDPVVYRGDVIRLTTSIGFAPVLMRPGDDALTWERALGLIDQALYMAKLHGRNRAYGIAKIANDDAFVAAERDLEAAWQLGLVEMRVLVNGPRPDMPHQGYPATTDAIAT